MYNIIFTSLPVIWFALFDYEFPRKVFIEKPFLYKVGPKNKYFKKRIFWWYLLYGAI